MDLLEKLKIDFKQFKFVQADKYMWSPSLKTIYFKLPLSKYSLLHELGHAICNHKDYNLDVQLLKLEVDAWHQAKQTAVKYKIKISQKYINDCINTYRDWLDLRAKCPKCNLVSLQDDDLNYNCLNCSIMWTVPTENKCLTKKIKQLY